MLIPLTSIVNGKPAICIVYAIIRADDILVEVKKGIFDSFAKCELREFLSKICHKAKTLPITIRY